MPFILTDAGAEQIAKSYFKKTNPVGGNDFTMRLFTNSKIPTDTDTLASFTEAVGGGYTSKIITADDATVSVVEGITQCAFLPQSFIFSGPLTTNTDIYGVYLVDADNVVIGAELFGVEYTPQTSGDILDITLVIQLSKGIPA